MPLTFVLLKVATLFHIVVLTDAHSGHA